MNDTHAVFMHGWGMQPGIWQGLQQRLQHPSTLAGMAPPPGDMHAWSDEFAAALPANALLIAWSLGAMLALDVATRHPQRVRGLVLIAATPSFVQRADWAHALDAATVAAFREGFLRNPTRTQDRFVALQSFGDVQRHRVTEALRTELANPTEHAASLASGLRLLEQTDLRGALPDVRMPCLLIHGAQDALVPAAASTWLGQRWPGSETLLLPDAGHAPFLSDAGVISARIRQFINER